MILLNPVSLILRYYLKAAVQVVCPDMISANRGPFSGIFPREVDFLSQSHWLQVSLDSTSVSGTTVF